MNKNKLVLIFLSLGIYLLSTGGSYLLFANSSLPLLNTNNKTETVVDQESGNDYGALTFDPNQPKTEACPLTGVKYSKQQKDWWETHRPLGAMIENSVDARPQSGIPFADITYEAVAEGGISRTLNIFYCQDAGRIGPMRSARTYFLDWASEYGADPIYLHFGGANCNAETGSGCANGAKADALGQIRKYGWYGRNDIDGIYIGLPVFKGIDFPGKRLATEHTKYSNTNIAWKYAKDDRSLTNVDEEGNAWNEDFTFYTFKDDAPSTTTQKVSFGFWEGMADYAVDWTYNPKDNLYYRNNGGEAHMDRNTNKQLTTKNLVILFQREARANDGYEGNLHLVYGTTGSGKAIVFLDGKQTQATWKKTTRESLTTLTDTKGKEIELNRGKTWFEILPLDTDVTVQ